VNFDEIPFPDDEARAAARARQARLTKPAGALGRLEELSIWACGVQGQCPPRPFNRIRALVIAADHGIAETGVSAYPPEVTAQMLLNFSSGGAAVNVLAQLQGVGVRVVDVGVMGTPSEDKIREGSGRIDTEDALTAEEVERALATGVRLADEEVDEGADLLILGDMGIGNTTVAASLIAALTGSEPVSVTGRGTGIDDNGWMRKTVAIRDALTRLRQALGGVPPLGPDAAITALRVLGGADLAVMAGLLRQAAVRRTPVLLDGVVICAAALVAEQLGPGAQRWWLAGTVSPEPAQALALQRLGLPDPLVDLGLRLGEGSGALVALPILTAAMATLEQMATFDQAGVSERTA
jgi:nicotinate-nucleotide--dimethylbenzimidazole phosphoribosyltransferase